MSVPGYPVRQQAAPRRDGPEKPEVTALPGFEDVYKAERSGLVRYLMTMGADQYQADDAVQAAFARAWSGWDVIAHPRGWLYRVALHEYYRADRRKREIPAGDLLPDAREPLDSGDIAVLNEEEEMVRAAVAALPGRQRQVMALLLAGFTTAEVADQLGCDQAAVRQSQVRARDALARRLGIDRRNPR